MINLQHINKSFLENKHDVKVPQNLDLNVAKEEMLAILGASGSGKSTLLNILSTIMRPDAGTYTFSGNNILNCSSPFLSSSCPSQIRLESCFMK